MATTSVPITISAHDALGAKRSVVVTFTAQPIVVIGSSASPLLPVVSPASFTVATNPSSDTLVGHLTVSNLPLLALNIASGDPNHYFAVYPGSQNLRTAQDTAVGHPPDGNYSLGITATNAAGASPPGAVGVQVGAAPVVNNASFNLTLPATNGQVVGTMTASGSPNQWAITAGNSSGYFAINNSGVITVTAAGASGITATTYSLTCRATNSLGSGSGSTSITASQQGTLTPQHPTLLNGYAARPSWQVAGVDYAVGPATKPTKDPALINMAGVSLDTNSRSVSIAGNGITLDGYDFGLGGGWQLGIDGANVTISNCKFKINQNTGAYQIFGGTSATNLTITNNEFDGSDLGNPPGQALSTIRHNGNGTLTLTNNWFYSFAGHPLEQTQGNGSPSFSVVYKFNLVEQGALYPGYHLNILQFGGGTCSNADVQFNTMYQTPQVSGGEGFQFYMNTQGGSITTGTCAFNTLIATGGNAGDAVSYFIHINAYNDNSSSLNGTCHDNYTDTTAAFGWNYDAAPGWTFTNNTDMVTGRKWNGGSNNLI